MSKKSTTCGENPIDGRQEKPATRVLEEYLLLRQ